MTPLEIIRNKKDYFYKNLILVALLSIGISLVANYLSSIFASNSALLWIGIGCIVIATVAHVALFFRSKSFTIRADCVLLVDQYGHVVPIDRYQFSQCMEENTRSVFSEKRALWKIWEKAFSCEKIKSGRLRFLDGGEIIGKKKILNFVGEFVEYAFLQWLASNQSSYFGALKESRIELLTREKISSYLKQNRVLEMISKPYKKRAKFKNHDGAIISCEGEIHSIRGAEGMLYDRFDLRLPKHSSLYKEGEYLYIRNRNYTLRFRHGFYGFNGNLPCRFEELYLKREFGSVNVYEFHPELTIKLNPFFFLFWRDWRYLGWIDIIGEEFQNYFSFDAFIEKIGYEKVLTNFIVQRING